MDWKKVFTFGRHIITYNWPKIFQLLILHVKFVLMILFVPVPELCQKTRAYFEKASTQFATLAAKIPVNQYYRFSDHWRFIMQRYAFLVTLLYFLETEKLALHEDVGKILGGNFRRNISLKFVFFLGFDIYSFHSCH